MLMDPTQLNIWDKVFKNGPSKISGRQPLKNLKWYGLPQQTNHITSNFLKDVFHKFYLIHSWILCPIYFALSALAIFSAAYESKFLWLDWPRQMNQDGHQ